MIPESGYMLKAELTENLMKWAQINMSSRKIFDETDSSEMHVV